MVSIAASSSPVGSEVFALLAELVISGVVVLILRHYLPLRTTPAYLLVPIFLSLVLPASIVLLVPIDLATSARTDDAKSRGIWLPERLLLVSWRITYWLTFCLTWFILPILAEYSDAGYRDPVARFKYSLRSNAKYNAIVFGSGIAGLIYIFISYGVNLESFKGVLMALAYCWGLILAIYLMGHGLVAIPRSLFRNASISDRLRRIQAQAPKIHEKMDEAIQKLEDFEAQVTVLSQRKTGTARDFKEWIEELAETSNLPESRPRTLSRRMSAPSITVPTVITERYLADLTRQLHRARHSRVRYIDEWDRLIQNAAATQSILDSAASKRLEIGDSSPQASFLERLTLFTPYTRYLYYNYAVPYTRIFFGALLSLASLCIIWSEMIKYAKPGLSIISLTVVHHPSSDRGQIGFPGQVIAAFWMLYMCAAALSSLTEVKVWRGRALVRRNTAYESAFWYAMQVAKLSIPLAYNFMTFLDPAIYTKTTFYGFLGKLIVLTPLGKWFDFLFPTFILVPVCATLFNLYGRAKRAVGFGGGIIDDEDEDDLQGYGTGSWREGRDLIERELGSVSAGTGALGHLHDGPADRTTSSRSRQAGGASLAPSSTSRTVPPRISTAVPARPSEVAPEDETFFEAFGHRVRNTLDTVNTPKWMQDGIKRPKWMGGDDDGGGGSGSTSRGSFTRLFSGSGGDGRVRL